MTSCVWGNKVMLTFLPQLPGIELSTNITAEDPSSFPPLCQFPPGIPGTSQVLLHVLMPGSPDS